MQSSDVSQENAFPWGEPSSSIASDPHAVADNRRFLMSLTLVKDGALEVLGKLLGTMEELGNILGTMEELGNILGMMEELGIILGAMDVLGELDSFGLVGMDLGVLLPLAVGVLDDLAAFDDLEDLVIGVSDGVTAALELVVWAMLLLGVVNKAAPIPITRHEPRRIFAATCLLSGLPA